MTLCNWLEVPIGSLDCPLSVENRTVKYWEPMTCLGRNRPLNKEPTPFNFLSNLAVPVRPSADIRFTSYAIIHRTSLQFLTIWQSADVIWKLFFALIGMLSSLDKLSLKVFLSTKIENRLCYPDSDNNLLGISCLN
jgi:hypothetical protein